MPRPPISPAVKRAGNSTHGDLLEGRTETTLTEHAKIVRDAFVVEYIKDFRGELALARCGYEGKNGKKRSSEMLREPYVARKLDALIRQLKPEDIVQRQQVMAKLWEESNNPWNLCSTRVAAQAHIAKMLGMMINKEEGVGTSPVGVMFIPCSTPAEWEAAAPIAQALLKSNAAKHAA